MNEKIFSQNPREQVKIEVKVKNASDPINDLICSNCLLYVNCSAACEHLDEVYSRIGQEFYDNPIIYELNKQSGKKRRDIKSRIIQIIKEYLKEKEICYGNQGNTRHYERS